MNLFSNLLTNQDHICYNLLKKQIFRNQFRKIVYNYNKTLKNNRFKANMRMF
jgi:hypothetical protein